jgi:general secretion pathway protein J
MIQIKQQPSQQKAKGFTLLEIIIALFILSILAMVAITSLRPVLRTQEQSKFYLERLEQLQLAYMQMQRDSAQMMFPPFISPSGDLIEFTGNGFTNPFNQETRTTLQQVSYTILGNQVIRSTQQTEDQGPYNEISSKVILDNVINFNVEPLYLQPMLLDNPDQLPAAIAVSMVLDNQQTLYWLFTVDGEGIYIAPNQQSDSPPENPNGDSDPDQGEGSQDE